MSDCNAACGESPREKLLGRGPQALSDAELLALLLPRAGGGNCPTRYAAALLQGADGLAGLLAADRRALLQERGLGPASVSRLLAAVELAARCARQPLTRRDVMTSPEKIRLFLQHHLGSRSREVFCCLFLDSQHHLLCCEDVFSGTLDGAAVYPREVVLRALHHRAAAVVLAHNHPSGLTHPSSADRHITQRLRDALALVDIRVLDHFIIGRGRSYSFAEAGLL
ncbi:RadC family protein [Congregibacter litoralis]|uniref:DNA replication and repair protein RadC n=1 Tax=Congregibacter litoralis KT71 TaxID=314285 RepID=A4A9B6_9GAMM|nr:DNA repair protein RadC [Congregibacter litoralis]EAQ97658.1 DNA replication and repair protein RadC [Congregibacter litoralis KT71]